MYLTNKEEEKLRTCETKYVLRRIYSENSKRRSQKFNEYRNTPNSKGRQENCKAYEGTKSKILPFETRPKIRLRKLQWKANVVRRNCNPRMR